MRFYPLSLLTLAIMLGSMLTTALAATQQHDGNILHTHPNPLLQEPVTIATFSVAPSANLRATKATIAWRLANNTFNSADGALTVPDAVAIATEYSLTLIDPAGNTWPIRKPILYTIDNTVLKSSVSASHLANLSTANNQNSTEVFMVGPMLNDNGFIEFDAQNQAKLHQVVCEEVTWHRGGNNTANIFPVCASHDEDALTGFYPENTFMTKSGIMELNFPTEIMTFGVWRLVATDTRPIQHDRIGLNMLPLSSGPLLVNQTVEKTAAFPRLKLDVASIVFSGTNAPLPDTANRTIVFRNELKTASQNIANPVISANNNNQIRNFSRNNNFNLPANNAVTNTLLERAEEKAHLGANTIIMSGIRPSKIKIDLHLEYQNSSERPAIDLMLVMPNGRNMALDTNSRDGHHQWEFSATNNTLPEYLADKAIDGEWKVIAQSRTGRNISNRFLFDVRIAVSGTSTDFFDVIELAEPHTLRDGQSLSQSFAINHSQPIKKLWFKGLANNFIGFTHAVTLKSPRGEVIPACITANDNAACIEIGMDGISRLINLDTASIPNGNWQINWKVKKIDDALAAQAGNGIETGTCSIDEMTNDPTMSARNNNSLAQNISTQSFSYAYAAAKDTVTINGFIIGFGETIADKKTIQHAMLDRAEAIAESSMWFNRYLFEANYWRSIEQFENLWATSKPAAFVDILNTTQQYISAQNLNALLAQKTANQSFVWSNRLTQPFNLNKILLQHNASIEGAKEWASNSHPIHAWSQSLAYALQSTPEDFDPNLRFYLSGWNNAGEFYGDSSAGLEHGGVAGGITFGGCLFAVGSRIGGYSVPLCGVIATGVGAFVYSSVMDSIMANQQNQQNANQNTDTESPPESNASPENADSPEDIVCTNDADTLIQTCVSRNKEDGALTLLSSHESGEHHFNGRRYYCENGSCTDTGPSHLTRSGDEEIISPSQLPINTETICDSSTDPNCAPTPNCDPSVDENCETSDTETECDPNTDTNCETAETTCDPETDPDCETPSEEVCDPATDANCETSTAETECNPEVENCAIESPCRDLDVDCNTIPPQGWFQTYAADSTDPIIQYWGNLAPYINCGRDGDSCTRSRLIPITPIEALGITPFINCHNDNAACEDNVAKIKVCTAFNWADTFTDPVPDSPIIPGDTPTPDCTDASQPCAENQ